MKSGITIKEATYLSYCIRATHLSIRLLQWRIQESVIRGGVIPPLSYIFCPYPFLSFPAAKRPTEIQLNSSEKRYKLLLTVAKRFLCTLSRS